MIAVIFEVRPADRDAYLAIAADLLSELEALDGFVSVERFQSLSHPEKLLSLSYFRDETAVRAWRTRPAHRAAQAEGRNHILADYRLRVVEVLRDYGMTERDEAPADSHEFHG